MINNSDKYKDYQLSSNDYCIVNSNWMNQIKTFYKFDLISNNLKSNKEIENILERNQENNSFKLLNLKNIYKIIKQIPSNNFEKLNFKSDKEYFNSNSYDVEVNQVKKAENEFFFVYINFEILNKNIVQLFQTEINKNENNFSEIIINDKNIIINLPKNFYGFNQYIAMIGKVNDYTFINDYILVYHHKYQGEKIYKIIKNGLNEFLNKFQNNDFFAPIMDDDSDDVLGEIIKHNKKKYSDNNFINKEVDINNNDEYNLNPPHNRIVLIEKSFINNVPLIGLENIGATCYMNATLQCFCHIKKFVNKFKYSPGIIDKVRMNKKNLTAAFKLLIEKLWPDNYNPNNFKSSYPPKNFKDTISRMNPLFQGIAANDAKDLVNFIIMTLHEELNEANNNIQNNNNIFIDQRDQQLVYNMFINNFKAKNNSIISNLFYAINCNITQCGGCPNQTFNYQTYFFIVFPLEEVRKFKFGDNYLFNSNIVDIYDCFNYDRKINYMTGDNAMYCNYCKRNCNSSMQTILITGPPILILLLNRGKGKQYDVKINFVEFLDLSSYIQNFDSGVYYNLIGVITHLGDSGMSGHFIAYCRDPIYRKWYKFNDAIVTPVVDFKKEVIDFAMPYLLFYEKQK